MAAVLYFVLLAMTAYILDKELNDSFMFFF